MIVQVYEKYDKRIQQIKDHLSKKLQCNSKELE